MNKASGIALALFTLVMAGMATAQGTFVAPRNMWGQPDLQGVWNFSSNVPMQRPQQFGERQFMTNDEVAALRQRLAERDAASDAAVPQLDDPSAGGYNDFWVESAGITDHIRTSHIVYPLNGRYPERSPGSVIQFGGLGEDIPGTRPVRFTVGGIAKDGPEDRGLSERCIIGFNDGPPFSPSLYNNNAQIFQHKDTAVILTEMIHNARIVPLDGRPPLPEEITQWSGDARGYYDGDTLVVVSTNFNGMAAALEPFGTSHDKVLTERFTRIDELTVEYEWTVESPSTFTDKITAVVPMTKVAGQLYEYACHEGNYGMVNLLRAERIEEQRNGEGNE